jgi:endonuclease V-like protein UPF0215 family
MFLYMKKQIRLLGIDDAPFNFKDTVSPVIGVIMRGGSYIECVLKEEITIDGIDATDICLRLINKSRQKSQLKAMLLDGISLGGFNVVDIQRIYETMELPVITITRDRPDLKSIKNALTNNFKDWETRWNLINQGVLHEVGTKHNPIFIKICGVSLNEAKEIIKISTIRGVIPEPIRVAHLIASGITRGESYGKA